MLLLLLLLLLLLFRSLMLRAPRLMTRATLTSAWPRRRWLLLMRQQQRTLPQVRLVCSVNWCCFHCVHCVPGR
jgi:hypothetical protein